MPAVLAIVLGPIAEPKLRQSLLLSDGDFSIFSQGLLPAYYSYRHIVDLLPLFKLIRDKIRKTA